MHDVYRSCTALQLSSSVVAPAVNFMLTEENYRNIVQGVAQQCTTRLEKQLRSIRTPPFHLLKLGYIFQRTFSHGIHIPAFVLDKSFGDRYGLKQDLSDSTARILEQSEGIEELDLCAISESTGLSIDQVSFGIDNITNRIGKLAVDGAFMLLDFGVGTLFISQHTAEFEFSQQQPERSSSPPHLTIAPKQSTVIYPVPPNSPRHESNRAVGSPRLDLNATTIRPAFNVTGNLIMPYPNSQKTLTMKNGGLAKHLQRHEATQSRQRTPSFDVKMKNITARVSVALQKKRFEHHTSFGPEIDRSSRSTTQKNDPTTAFSPVDAAKGYATVAAVKDSFASKVHENLGNLIARNALSETWRSKLRGRGPVIIKVYKPFGPQGRGPIQKEKEVRRGKSLLKELRIGRLALHANLLGIVKAEFRARKDALVGDSEDKKKRSEAQDWWWCAITYDHPKYTLGDMVNSPLTRQAHFGSMEERRTVLTQIIGAVNYLHEKLGIAHRALTTANVLTGFGDNCPPNARYRIANFGSAQILGVKANRKVAPLAFRPPELVAMHESQVMVRESHDIWAVGAIYFEILLGAPLLAVARGINEVHHVESEAEYKTAHHRLQTLGSPANYLPRHVSEAEVEVLEALLHSDTYKRPKTSAIAKYDFLRGKVVPANLSTENIDMSKIEEIQNLDNLKEVLESEVSYCEKLFVEPPLNTGRSRGGIRGRGVGFTGEQQPQGRTGARSPRPRR